MNISVNSSSISNEIVNINTDVDNMIKYSNLAIKTNYFEHLFNEKKKYEVNTED